VAVVPTWTRVQGLVPNAPVLLELKLTLPVGKLLVPASVSPTVAVQVLAALTGTEAGVQVTVVVVPRGLTPRAKLAAPELALVAWAPSPP
jgi:hypothetical protein